ncbi:MAG TPA: cob(I)yrinic acid a,c-diamide adenosyltransferase [Candidatus Paceibacterota bacterium]
MLYTRKGDTGTTKIFGCDQRFSKSSAVAEALGAVDELNSFLGLCKVRAKETELSVGERAVSALVEEVQQNLFIVQAGLAGADKHLAREKIAVMEQAIGDIETVLPPITSFFVSGGTELAALFDVARTIARRAERRVVALYREQGEKSAVYGKDPTNSAPDIQEPILAYLNRLSSLLYALARLANHAAGITEDAPTYR